MPFSPSNSEFFVEKQESLAVDKFTKNGSSKELHMVAKSIPFVIHVASTLDLNNSSFEAKLIYDAEDQKEVETVKSEPMEFVVHVNSMGDKAAVEVRIFVLSSQHEGAFFRVKLSITEKDTEQTFTTFSNPIKVVSKRNQVKKMLERNEIAREDNPHIEVAHTSPKRPAPSTPNTDNIQEVLLRLEEQQREQAQLLRQLVSQKANPVSFDCGTVPSPNDMDFEAAFQNFLAAFQKVPSSERSTKLRKVMQSSEVSRPMNEFLDVANAECGRNLSDSLMQSIFTLPSGNTDDINCQYSNCPPKSATEELETFYNDFFQEPLTPPTVAQMMISS